MRTTTPWLHRVAAVLATVLAVVAGTALPAAAHEDVEPNNSCSEASRKDLAFGDWTGHVSATDPWDYFWFDVSANNTITMRLDPIGNDFDLYLYDPDDCLFSVERGEGLGGSIENITHHARKTGRYYAEVRRFTGEGDYHLRVTVTAVPPRSCTTSTLPGSSCSISSQSCASSSCVYQFQMQASGLGVVAGSFGPAHCTGALSCSHGAGETRWGSFTAACVPSDGLVPSVAATGSVTCTLTL